MRILKMGSFIPIYMSIRRHGGGGYSSKDGCLNWFVYIFLALVFIVFPVVLFILTLTGYLK